MDQIYDRVAGLDVHRDNVVACFRRLGPRGGVVFEKDRFRSTTAGLRELEAWLAERQVELVAMEATGVYWKPVYYALESRFTVWLCNARTTRQGGHQAAQKSMRAGHCSRTLTTEPAPASTSSGR